MSQTIVGLSLGVGAAVVLNLAGLRKQVPLACSLVSGTVAVLYFAIATGWYISPAGFEFSRLLGTPVLGAAAGLGGLLMAYAIIFMLGSQNILLLVLPVLCGAEGWKRGGILGAAAGVVAPLAVHGACSCLLEELNAGRRRAAVITGLIASALASLSVGRFVEALREAHAPIVAVVDGAGLAGLAGKAIAVFPARLNPGAFRDEGVPAEVLERLIDRYDAALAPREGGPTGFRGADGPRRLPADFASPDEEERRILREYLAGSGLDGALLTRCAFGFTDVNATQYWFACDTVLVGRDGRPVWHYYGKAWMLQSPGQALRPDEFARQVTAPLRPPPAGRAGPGESGPRVTGDRMVPSGFVAGMESVCDSYAPYVLWMLEKDLAGRPGDSSYAGSPLPSKDPNILVTPASSSSPPYVRDAPAPGP